MQAKFVLIIILCGQLIHVSGQSFHPLNIGDTLKNIDFTYSTNNQKFTGNLPDSKAQLIILDFWATWCSSCIKALPKVEILQEEFKDEVQFFLINAKNSGDDSLKIKRFFSRWKERYGKALGLKSIEQDSVFSTLFPHQLVPHYVWIEHSGKVVAFTGAEELSTANIRKTLKGMSSGLVMKKDQSKGRPLFTNEDIPLLQLQTYRLLIKGKFYGLGSGNRLHYRGDTLTGRAITNTPLKEMYTIILREMYPGFAENRMVTEIRDNALWSRPVEEEARERWNREHMYSLEVILPLDQANHLYEEMLLELNRSSGYYGSMELRTVPVMALYKTGRGKLPYTKGGEKEILLFNGQHPSLTNAPVRYLTVRLNNCPAIAIPVINETGISDNIDIDFPEGFGDMDTIRKRLQHFGLDLKKAERELEVFVIRER